MSKSSSKFGSNLVIALIIVFVAFISAGIAALMLNIFEKKTEAQNSYVQLVEVTERDTDPEKWKVNWPRQYDSYKKTSIATRTRFGGHGGSEALPEQKIERDPWLKRMFKGYAFSIDYRDRRGHAYMLRVAIISARPMFPGLCFVDVYLC